MAAKVQYLGGVILVVGSLFCGLTGELLRSLPLSLLGRLVLEGGPLILRIFVAAGWVTSAIPLFRIVAAWLW